MSDIPASCKVYQTPRAYQDIQADVVSSFNLAIGKTKEDIKTIVIVGAYHGYEISDLLGNYPNAKIYAFEANPRHFAGLEGRFRGHHRVELFNVCIGDSARPAQFYEITLPGSGSIFKYQGDQFGDDKHVDYVLDVQLQPLINFYPRFQLPIDLLWVDVQGAELEVLKGTDLSQVRAMFLEVKTHDHVKPHDAEPYKGQCFLPDLINRARNSHKLVSIGLDNEYNNGSGNSFWVKI